MRDHERLNCPVIVPLPAEIDVASADAAEHRYMGVPGERSGNWTLLTGHGNVLMEIARNPDAWIRDISPAVGLTERTVQAIVADLDAAGYLTWTRVGRRTRYSVNLDSPFRHKAQQGLRVGPLLDQLTGMGDADTPARRRPGTGHSGAAVVLEAAGDYGYPDKARRTIPRRWPRAYAPAASRQ